MVSKTEIQRETVRAIWACACTSSPNDQSEIYRKLTTMILSDLSPETYLQHLRLLRDEAIEEDIGILAEVLQEEIDNVS